MDQPYSFWADLLSKFHTAPEWIQALWLLMVPVTLLGVTGLVMRGLRGHLVHSVVRDAQGRWVVYRREQEAQQID